MTKEEKKEYLRQWYAKNRDRQRALNRDYSARHREENKRRCREWYAHNKERHALYRKQYADKHRDHLLEWHRQYHLEHREQRLAKQRIYAKAHIADKSAYDRQYAQKPENKRRKSLTLKKWIAEHPGEAKANALRYRAIKRKATVNLLAIKEFVKSVKSKTSAVCYYCHQTVPTSRVHFDHIVPLSRGGEHSIKNLCVACSKCNLSKTDKPIRVWITTGQQLLEL